MKCLLLPCLFALSYGANLICQMKPEPGLCAAYFPMYYYDADSRECKKFIYGGCGGNENRFRTQEECEKTCGEEYADTTCHEKPDPGLCRGFFPRYYFDPETGECSKFIFGGCGGNDNNFETEEGCLMTCGKGSRRF